MKKQTILSVLIEIKALLEKLVAPEQAPKTSAATTITFPAQTAKQIMEECDNKVAGGKLLYNTDWYKNEAFFTTETCRPRTVHIPDALEHGGESWNEVNALGEMFNFAEIVYLLRESAQFRALLRYDNSSGMWWTWTSSHASGGCLVPVGEFGVVGAYVDGYSSDYRSDRLGVSFSRSE